MKLPKKPAKQGSRLLGRDANGRDRVSRDYANQLVNGVMRELRRDAMRREFDRLADF